MVIVEARSGPNQGFVRPPFTGLRVVVMSNVGSDDSKEASSAPAAPTPAHPPNASTLAKAARVAVPRRPIGALVEDQESSGAGRKARDRGGLGLTTDETEACLIVKDRKGQALAYVYFEDERASRRAELTYYDHRQATTERCDAWCRRLRGGLGTRSTKILRPGVVVALMFAVCILLAIAVALTF